MLYGNYLQRSFQGCLIAIGLLIGIAKAAEPASDPTKLSCIDAFTSELLPTLSDKAKVIAIETRLQQSLKQSAAQLKSQQRATGFRSFVLLPLGEDVFQLALMDRGTVVKTLFELFDKCSEDECELILYSLSTLDRNIERYLKYRRHERVAPVSADSDILAFLIKRLRQSAMRGVGRRTPDSIDGEDARRDVFRAYWIIGALREMDESIARQQFLEVSHAVLEAFAVEYVGESDVWTPYDQAVLEIAQMAFSHKFVLSEMLPTMRSTHAKSQAWIRLLKSIDPSWNHIAMLPALIVKTEMHLETPSSLAVSMREFLREAQGVPLFESDMVRMIHAYGFVLSKLEVIPHDLSLAVAELLEKWIADIRVLAFNANLNPEAHLGLNAAQTYLADFVELLRDCRFSNQEQIIGLLKSAVDLPWMNESIGYDFYKTTKALRIQRVYSYWTLRKK